MPKLLTSSVVAEILGVSPNTVKRWAESGLLPNQKTLGGHRRFRHDVVLKFLDGLESSPPPIQNKIQDFIKRVLSEKVSYVSGEILELHEKLTDWWKVAEFLGHVLHAVGECWENQNLTVSEEHYFSVQLTRSLEFLTKQVFPQHTHPICLLATPPDEPHLLGLRLAELCVRDAGLNPIWLGPLGGQGQHLNAYLQNPKTEFLVLSASCFQSNKKEMAKLARSLELNCHKNRVNLVLGGTGAWPEVLTHGHRIRDFETFHQFLMESKTKVN